MGKANPSKSAVLESSYRSLRWGWPGLGGGGPLKYIGPREMGCDRAPMGQFQGPWVDFEFICALLIHGFTLRESWERDLKIFSNAWFRPVLFSVASNSSVLIT